VNIALFCQLVLYHRCPSELPFTVNQTWSIPVCLLAVSVKWWNNFVDSNTRLGAVGRKLNELHQSVAAGRTYIAFIDGIVKSLLLFTLVVLRFVNPQSPEDVTVSDLFR
jgi:hypothetical protein